MPAEQAHIGPHRQTARALRRAIGRDLAILRAHADGCVHHAGDAEGVAVAPCPLDRRDEFLIGRIGDDLLDGIAAVLGHQPGERTIDLLDRAAGRHRRLLVDARQLQRQRIGDREMAAGAHDVDRIVRGRLVEFRAVRMPLHIELEMIVATRQDPFAGLGLRGSDGDHVEKAIQRAHEARPDVEFLHRQAERQQMQMRLVEARRRHAAGEIDDLRIRADQRLHVGGRAGRQDLARPERDRGRVALLQPQIDWTVPKNEIGFRQGRHRISSSKNQFIAPINSPGNPPQRSNSGPVHRTAPALRIER